MALRIGGRGDLPRSARGDDVAVQTTTPGNGLASQIGTHPNGNVAPPFRKAKDPNGWEPTLLRFGLSQEGQQLAEDSFGRYRMASGQKMAIVREIEREFLLRALHEVVGHVND